MKINNYVLSWDFILSCLFTLFSAIFLQFEINASFTLGIYNIGISVISIIFSLFFAALAILLTNQDDEFILFLEENNYFIKLIEGFKFTLIALFVCLIVSIILYSYTSYLIMKNNDKIVVSTLYFYIFEFFFCYSLFSTLWSVLDTITFTTFKIQFLKQKNSTD